MKTTLILFALILFSLSLRSQEIGWYNRDSLSAHLVAVHAGADIVTAFGVSYGYKFTGKKPMVLGLELTTPFGGQIMDDFEARLTGQSIFWPARKWGVSIKPSIACRRYGSETAVLVSIGAGLSTSIGFYKEKWSIAAEAGYDHIGATHINHRLLKEYYPEIRDGWYSSTGGNFNFGVLATYWMGATGVSIKLGKTFGQNFSDGPTIPYYADLSVIRKW